MESFEERIRAGEKMLAVLLDPENVKQENVPRILDKIHESVCTHILIGGSTVSDDATELLVKAIKSNSHLPVIIFPGHPNQICENADALLFLSLISGRNSDYLIGKHVEAASILKNLDIEVIPSSYLLIGDNGSAVEKVSNTSPMSVDNIETIIDTALAGKLLGHKCTYLEAGSGAKNPVKNEIILRIKETVQHPLIVGGGIRNLEGINDAYTAGADMVVIGTSFEDDIDFFHKNQLVKSSIKTNLI
ncbi:MAG: geranylgeranylglyceryl/heptaprenylglyceryl phosphate synthase [Flavobacteriaceae bacterium]|nr:geranylgeranylglyceryl/heptaprenylglyceryl phosphate synthase [Flavobacteriaceae bacterium]